MFLGLRTIIYPANDLAASKAWFTEVTGTPPYFDEPFYVGFNVGGYELGLLPDGGTDGPVTYWGVANIDEAWAVLIAAGATADGEIEDVGDKIRIAKLREPGGSILGIIENPHFEPAPAAPHAEGPGR